MSSLIVTAHPNTDSLTHRAEGRLQELLGPDTVMAHLAQEGFDPRYTSDDHRRYTGLASADAAIVAEQRRVDRAAHLVLVFPIYWWSMPALLKGWVDRVFIRGWAFDDASDEIVPRLGALTAHLLPIAGSTEDAFTRYGYTGALRTQIDQGITEFCGMQRGVTAFIYDADSTDRAAIGRDLEAAVATVAAAIRS